MIAALALLPTMLSTFSLREVELLDSPFKRANQLNAKVLLDLEPDRFLHNTRRYAGLKPKAEVYGGWESRGVAGHSLGHYLTALSLEYTASGDKRFRDRIDYIVHEMAVCQKAYGDGYVGALPPLELSTLRGLKDGKVSTNGGFGFEGGAWVPWYTQHKVLAGLKDAWLVAGCPEAKEVTLKLADWVDSVTAKLSPEQVQQMLAVEHGGMNETLADLYAQTGEERYLEVSKRFYHRAVLDPLQAGRDELPGKHANTQIPKVIGMARTYEVTGDPAGRSIAENFWSLVTGKYTFAMGGNSDREHFFPETEAHRHLSPESAESCNTYNMLKLTEHLFSWSPKASYGDYFERALYNHILASQDPKTGMYAYFMSLKPGHFRTFSTLDNSFWCCVGSGMENHTKYAEGIYYHDDANLYVNLYIPSVLRWKEKGLVLEQATKYPEDGVVELTVKEVPKTPVSLHLRIPGWCTATPAISLNGSPLDLNPTAGSFATVTHDWKVGDRVRLILPLGLRAEHLKGDPTKVAFMYGPLTLAGNFGEAPEPISPDHTSNERKPVAEVPEIVTPHLEDATQLLEPVAGQPLTWKIRGVETALVRPYVDSARQYTTVYWDVVTPAQKSEREAKRQSELEIARIDAALTIDEFHPGEQQSEVDHGLAGSQTESGDWGGRKWRHASNGGWFSFQLKVEPGIAQRLRFTFNGLDAGREFDILVNDEKIATYRVVRQPGDELFNADFPLTPAMLAGKDRITVKLAAKRGGYAGGIYYASTMRNPN